MAHTPGPWTAGKDEHGNNCVRAGRPRRGYNDCILARVGDPSGQGQDESNTRLIAVAPELLHILKLLVEQDFHPRLTTLSAARAAIAKAEGK